MSKLNKQETGYSIGMIHSHCGKTFSDDKGYCRHFQPPNKIVPSGHCEVVTGIINPVYWCDQFKKVEK